MPCASSAARISSDWAEAQAAELALLPWEGAAQATLAQVAREGPESAGPKPVIVRLGRDQNDATITIDDTGTGLAPAVRDRLFQPFASGRPGGAGLGLALARRIVAMHGGRLEISPREPHGVRAEIRLQLGESATFRNASDRQS